MEKGTLQVRDLEVLCILGCEEWERKLPQRIALDIEVDYDISQAAVTDNIATAVDYRDIAQSVAERIQERKYLLIERLVHECCELILNKWSQVDRVKLAVRKFRVIPSAGSTGLVIERRR